MGIIRRILERVVGVIALGVQRMRGSAGSDARVSALSECHRDGNERNGSQFRLL